MFKIENTQTYTQKIIYDLEFSGDLRKDNGINCCIWQIAAKDQETGLTFCTVVNPYKRNHTVPKPVDDRYKMPTEEELYSTDAPDIVEAMHNFRGFLDTCLESSKKKAICLISHNGFRSDKVIFENALIRYDMMNIFNGIHLYFFDTLYYFRKIYPGLSSYSLANLYMYKFNQLIEDAHDATVDVIKLEELLCTETRLKGSIYPLYSIPFTNVSGVGSFTENMIGAYGYISVDHLLSSFMNQKQSIILFLQSTILADRATLLTNRFLDFIINESNQRIPTLLKQQQELKQTMIEES